MHIMGGSTQLLAVVIHLFLGLGLSEALLCLRCDSWNQGESCENRPASRHIRNFGDEEPCLSFEDVNNQYLALQRDIDPEWYFSVFNGDHGIPLRMLKKAAVDGAVAMSRDSSQLVNANDSSKVSGGKGGASLLSSDRDVACIYIRTFFHHDVEETTEHTGTVLWFRKCVQLPSLDYYPVCGEGPIYKGHIEVCVCRMDRCNIDRIVEGPGGGLITAHHVVAKNRATSKIMSVDLIYLLILSKLF